MIAYGEIGNTICQVVQAWTLPYKNHNDWLIVHQGSEGLQS